MSQMPTRPVHVDATASRTTPSPFGGAGAVGGPYAAMDADHASLQSEVLQLNSILDSATDYAIITLDLNGNINRWNAGAGLITGYIAAEVLGRSGDIIFTSEDRADGRFAVELCRAIEEGRAVNERWHLRRDGSRFWASGLMMPLLDAAGRPDGFLNILRDRTEVRAEAERRELLMAEMGHRIKNAFATVQAVSKQTGRHAATIEDFQAAFAARLKVLSRSHDMLMQRDWTDAPLRTIIEGALDAYRGGSNPVTLDGVAVILAAPLVVAMSMAFYELATNAAKYGALSVQAGHVDVSWTVIPSRPGKRRVEIVWRERGGPPVVPPERRGFGSQLLQKGLPSGGAVALEYLPAGLECRLTIPLGTVVEP